MCVCVCRVSVFLIYLFFFSSQQQHQQQQQQQQQLQQQRERRQPQQGCEAAAWFSALLRVALKSFSEIIHGLRLGFSVLTQKTRLTQNPPLACASLIPSPVFLPHL